MSFPSAQSGITGVSYQPVIPDAFPNPLLAEYVNRPSRESLGGFPAAEDVQQYDTFNACHLTFAIPGQDLSGQGYLTGRLSSSATALNPSPWLRQAEQSKQDSAVSPDMFFNNLSNTKSPSSHTVKRETADWQDDTNDVGLLPFITSPPPTQFPHFETQIHQPYEMGLYRSDHGATQTEMADSVPDIPFLMYKYVSEHHVSGDTFAVFPLTDSGTDAVDRHNWANA